MVENAMPGGTPGGMARMPMGQGAGFTTSLCDIPYPAHERPRTFLPGSPERDALKKELERQKAEKLLVPLFIDREGVNTDKVAKVYAPHDKNTVVCEVNIACQPEYEMAIESVREGRHGKGENIPWENRAIFLLKVAEQIAHPYRDKITAAAMLSMGMTANEAEAETCRLIDYLRFNAYFLQEANSIQPVSADGYINRNELRPLDGFVAAISPINSFADAANQIIGPFAMSNCTIWNVAKETALPLYYFNQAMMYCGLNAGGLCCMPCEDEEFNSTILTQPELAGVSFIGTTEKLQDVYEIIGKNIRNYQQFPRIVGDASARNFIFAHHCVSSNVLPLVVGLIRGAFEYSGQKAGSVHIASVPFNSWPEIKENLLKFMADVKAGDPGDFNSFTGAVINEATYNRCVEIIEYAKASDKAEIVCGGYDSSKGWFIEPTIIHTDDLEFKSAAELGCGPIITVCTPAMGMGMASGQPFSDNTYPQTMSIYVNSRAATNALMLDYKDAAGTIFYNDKPTDALVGEQPVGGSKLSGTNDRIGSMQSILRWLAPALSVRSYIRRRR